MPHKRRPNKPLRAGKARPRPLRVKKPAKAKPLRILDATRMGRPSKYKPEYAHIASIMVRGGSTDFELAQAFECAESTLYEWKARYPDFSESIAGARAIPIERAERSLYHRAVGYSFTAIKIVVVNGQVTAVNYVEHVPPDPNAARLWLLNVDPLRWRDRREIAVENPKDERTERELTDDEIYARLAAIEEQRRNAAAIEVEAVEVRHQELLPVLPK